ncbi:MAG: FAD-dependent oxidoreductase [Acidobacteria bacterium]|nr:FAD-dependent oxidoreductase [Acidobacteriota bacterium]
MSQPRDPDVIVVGAGIAGLAAALETAQHGASVLVIDLWSVFGGHAIVSGGGVLLTGTPNQDRMGVVDTEEILTKDFFEWGKSPDPDWVRYYVKSNRKEIHDWLLRLGVSFNDPFYDPIRLPGNSRPRFHQAKGGGFGLVSPIYRAALAHPNVEFLFNTEGVELLISEGRIQGVRVRNARNGELSELKASAVILATGGFQSNLDLVKSNWPAGETVPREILAGSGPNSLGSGLVMAKAAGGSLHRMDHMWNYSSGMKDPRDLTGKRGLRTFNTRGIWVNQSGQRFLNEDSAEGERLKILLKQPGTTYWNVFDEPGRSDLSVFGWNWMSEEEKSRALVKADTLEELALRIGLPAQALQQTVARYNQMVDSGADEDFDRFRNHRVPQGATPPVVIAKPPFYAFQGFPLARKSMGGIRTDQYSRVVDSNNNVIPGLYAAGEVAGFGGINGVAALEGTFLGPSLLMGRVAGAKAVEDLRGSVESLHREPRLLSANPTPPAPEALESAVDSENCVSCHTVAEDLKSTARGYEHFRLVHRLVFLRNYNCVQCHSEVSSHGGPPHRIDRLRQVQNCELCHKTG